jgi:hypothetical protein
LEAVYGAFDFEIDYSMLVKIGQASKKNSTAALAVFYLYSTVQNHIIMKLLIFLACLLPYALKSQNILPDANTIIVKGVSFTQVCNALLDSGWAIEKKDNELQTVKTEFKPYPRLWNGVFCITVRVKDSIAYIGGLFTIAGGQLFKNEKAFNQTNRKGETHKKSASAYPFLLINQWARVFNKELTYQKL